MSSSLPSLSENRYLRLLSVAALYMSQGIGMGVVIISLPAVMAAAELDVTDISLFTGVVLMPWAAKFFLGPFMDRYVILSLGRRRPWVLIGILLPALCYLGTSLINSPFDNFWLFLTATAFSFGGTAVMDVAIDGMVVDIMSEEEQAQANGLMFGGKVFGTALAAWGSGWMFKHHGVSATFLAAGLATLAFGLIPLLFRERPGEKLFPWSPGNPSPESLAIQQPSWLKIWVNLRKIFILPGSYVIIGLIILVGGIQGMFDALIPVVSVQKLNWEPDHYSNVAAVSKLFAGAMGMILGGWTVNRWGHKRALFVFLIVLFCSAISMGLLTGLWQNQVFTTGQILLHHLFRTLALVTCFSIGMAMCWQQIAASQFAIYMAFGNLGIAMGSILMGRATLVLGYSHIFFVLASLAALGLLVGSKLDLADHRKRVQEF
ncbi:MAG: MFS transporter [Opitutales bacterium]|nr:MFS transporter [Opitutales bacterium]MDG2166674.1 MFS transporter [Opitutales bacterium]